MKSQHAFLVRCWYEPDAPSTQLLGWRFLISEIGGPDAAPHGFVEFEAMVRYLAKLLLAEHLAESGGGTKPQHLNEGEVTSHDES